MAPHGSSNSGKAGRSNNSSQNDEERNVDPGAAFRIQSGVEQTESTFTNGNCGNFSNFHHSARVSDAQVTRYAQQVPIQKPQSSNPQDIVIKVNCHFQHLNSHLLSKCERCQEAWKLYSHPTGCSLNKCDKCSFVKSIVGYHKRVCRMECDLCLGKLSLGRPENPIQVVDGNKEGATCQAISRACGTSSLDHDESEKVVDSLSSQEILPRTFTLPENHIFHHTNIYCVMEKLFQKLVGKYFEQDVDYEVCSKLGQGGNGQVFAVKLLPRGKTKLDGIFRDNDLAVKKANVRPNEIKVLKKLYNSQYFAQCYFIVHKKEKVRWKGRPRDLTKRMFVRKYDGSLSQHLDEHGPPELDDAMFFWIQVLLGVSYLHRLVPPIIHKDIKAGNVLLDDGLARLADFEYAVILDDDIKTEELPRCGTPFFVSPEVVKKGPHGPPTDVYGMGALFLEIMFKKRDKTFRPDKDYKDFLVRRLKKLDPALGELIGSCLEEDPSLRPTAVELLESDVVQKYIKSLQLSRIHPVLSGL